MITLGANTVGIGLVLRLRDQFSANANRINNQFQRLYGNAQRATKQNLSAARQVGVVMALMGIGAVRAFSGAVDTAAEFNYTLKGVQAVTKATTAEMKLLHDQSIAVALQSKYTARDVASAAEYLSKAGFEMPDIRASLKGVADLGAAADVAIGGKEGAAGIMANILNTFGLRASAAADVADVMSRAAVKSSVDLLDLAESIKYAGSVATMLKVPFTDINAMLAVMGNRGMRGSMAGVGLANMLQYLSKAVGAFRTRRQADALKMIGLDPKALVDARGNLKPMIEILDLFRQTMGKMATTQQVSILEGLMNIRGARAFVPLFQDTKIGLGFAKMLEDLRKNSHGASAEMAKMRMDTLKGDMMVLSDTWDAFKISVGETLEPIVRFGARFVTKVLGGIIKFASTPIGKTIVVLAAGLAVAAAIGGTLLVTFTSIKLLTFASAVSFANMGRALALAWNSGNAAALRYLTTVNGVMMAGKGRWRDPITGRFAKAPIAGAATGAASNPGIFGTIVSYLTSAFKTLGPLARGVAGGFGAILGAFTIAFGIKNIVKGVLFGLGYLMHGLIAAAKMIWHIASMQWWKLDDDAADFTKGVNTMAKSLKFGKSPIESWTPKPKEGFENSIGLKEKLEQFAKQKRPSQPAVVKMDGKKVGEVIMDSQRDDLNSLLKVRN